MTSVKNSGIVPVENLNNRSTHDSTTLAGGTRSTPEGRNTISDPKTGYAVTGKSIHIPSTRSSVAYLPIPAAPSRGKPESIENIFTKQQRIRLGDNMSRMTPNLDLFMGRGSSVAPTTQGIAQYGNGMNSAPPEEAIQQVNNTKTAPEIPVYELSKLEYKDPISLVESLAEEGRKFGAIKVKMPDSYIQEHECCVNLDRFTFKANRLLNNPQKNELYYRLKFYDEFIQFHSGQPRDVSSCKEDVSKTPLEGEMRNGSSSKSVTPELESFRGRSRFPVYLQKFPVMDKRALDLFDLFRFVIYKGGYNEVINRKLWAQVGRELGYKGKITSSLSSSLKLSYAKILYPLEAHLKDRVFEVIGENKPDTNPALLHQAALQQQASQRSISQQQIAQYYAPQPQDLQHQTPQSQTLQSQGDSKYGENEDGSSLPSTNNGEVKRSSPSVEIQGKNFKSNMDAPLILGSASEFRRSSRLKLSKGFLLNDPHLIDVKTPMVVSAKEKETGLESFVSPIGASAQVNNYLKWLACISPVVQDASRLEVTNKLATTCSLRQYIEKDSRFQDYLLSRFRGLFNEVYFTGVHWMEQVYWEYLTDKSTKNRWLGNCSKIRGTLVEGAMRYMGDGFALHKPQARVALYPQITPRSISNSRDINFKATNHENLTQASQNVSANLNPFELANISILPNSLLSPLTASDVANTDIIHPNMSIGMTFSTENWSCEDHFTQLCNYHAFGKSKRWYFIPESEFEKFEQFLLETIAAQNTESKRINKNYDLACWDVDSITEFMHCEDDVMPTQYECIYNSLENIVNPFPDTRAKHDDPIFQRMIEMQKRSISLNQEYLITPTMLTERGIKFTTTIQNPGEMIFKYPKTYSATISFGVNISEQANFASKLWLDYGIEGEMWLQKQGILPCISTFKLLANYASLLESQCKNKISFSSDVHSKVSDTYSILLEDELALRKKVRSQAKLKEVVIEERNFVDADFVTDDDMVSAIPSKIVIYSSSTGSSFSISLFTFSKYLENGTKISEDMSFSELLERTEYQTELHLFYSDEKLKSFQRSLSGYSIDFESWIARYDEMMLFEHNLPLKNYKLLLQEGEKLFAALSGTQRIFDRFCFGESLKPESENEEQRVKTFKNLVESLRKFVDESSVVVEQCQTILSLKHQQRIRNGGTENIVQEDHSESLQLLVDLVNKIPHINFYTPEFDLVLEYQAEILNFDKTCRTLLQQGSASLVEISDMINLGTSFGIQIPSLKFLIRLKERSQWMETYETIVSGGDPFSGRKEIFSLPDLRVFKEKGMQVLASGDREEMATIDQYLKDGCVYDNMIQGYLAENMCLNNIDLNELEAKIIDMEEKSKMKGASRLFVELKTYQMLVDLKGQEKRIRFLQEFSSKSHSLCEIRQQLSELESCAYNVDVSHIREIVDLSDQWLRKFDVIISTIRAPSQSTDIDSGLKNACTKLADKAQMIASKTKSALCSDMIDLFETSAPYLFANDLQDDFEEQTPTRYCLCREFEEGTMIECDSCHEWFHVTCVKDISVIGGDDERYVCPCCLELFAFQKTLQYPAFSDKLIDASLFALLQEGDALQIKPTVELNLLRNIWEMAEEAQRWFSDPDTQRRVQENGELYHLFLLRKFVGSPLLVGSIMVYLLNILRQTDVSKVSDQKSAAELVDLESGEIGSLNSVHDSASLFVANDDENIGPAESMPLARTTSENQILEG